MTQPTDGECEDTCDRPDTLGEIIGAFIVFGLIVVIGIPFVWFFGYELIYAWHVMLCEMGFNAEYAHRCFLL